MIFFTYITVHVLYSTATFGSMCVIINYGVLLLALVAGLKMEQM